MSLALVHNTMCALTYLQKLLKKLQRYHLNCDGETHFPSFLVVPDPARPGREKCSQTGASIVQQASKTIQPLHQLRSLDGQLA